VSSLRSPYFILFYFVITVGSISAFTYICDIGTDFISNMPPSYLGPSHKGSSAPNTLLHVLLSLVAVSLTAQMLIPAFERIKQPPVIAEVISGILWGPSLLGYFAPHLSGFLFHESSLPTIGIIAQIGVILYMFLIGLEVDLSELRKNGKATLAVSHASIIFPFLLGSILALGLYKTYSYSNVSFLKFALFMGVSMSITAFPVLARILADRGLVGSRMGNIALACAAIDDVTAWCLLAILVSVVKSDAPSGFWAIGLTFVFILLMLGPVKILVEKAFRKYEFANNLNHRKVTLILVLIFVFSAVSESIGIHAIFGAFLFGVILPHDGGIGENLNDRLGSLIRGIFLPAFFAYTGMRTQIGLLDSAAAWLICGLIICVAILGKFGGAFVSARFAGFSWKNSAGLGILMNARGLVELIVLNIGLDLGVISPKIFTMLVLMAVVTTLMTAPLLSLILRGKGVVEDWKTSLNLRG
jgi:Kef-type K+ transport system membrane component KefB